MIKRPPCIILTRPQKASENLAVQLHDRGYATCVNPVLAIQPTNNPLPDVSTVGAVMITSGHVFDVLSSDAHYREQLIHLPCFCVGTHTAMLARAYGFQNVFDAAGNGSDLAQLVARTQNDTTQQILHICARDVASTAQDKLVSDGYTLQPWQIYNANPATELTKPVVDGLQRNYFKAALFYSPRSASIFMDLVWQYGLEACCQSLIGIALSSVVADALPAHLWYRVVTAAQPTEDSVLHCLQEQLPPR